MTEEREYKWAETPWDDLDREGLIRELIKAQSAIRAAKAAIVRLRGLDKRCPYWDMACAALAKIEATASPDFPALRYVDSVAFEVRAKWTVCPDCGTMLGSFGNGETKEGISCSIAGFGKPGCSGVHRLITWEDIRA